jgi:hypothetical protein
MVKSVQLLAECTSRGLLSKEAAEQVELVRVRLIKQALQKEAISFFRGLRSKADDIAKATPTPKGILDKLRTGGRTGVEAVKDGSGPGWSDVGLNLAKMMALAGMTAGATAGVQGIMRHSRDKKVEGDIHSSYSQMFNEYPKLKELQESAPGRLERHFGVLAKFAPSLAADPTVAGSWLQNSMQTQYIGPSDVKALAETQSRIDEMHEQRHGTRGITGLKAGEFAAKAMGA